MIAKGKAKKAAIVAVMRKLLVIGYAILKNKTPYRNMQKMEAIAT